MRHERCLLKETGPNMSQEDRSEGLARTRLFYPWVCEPEEGVVRLWRSVSHVVGDGHLLTSGWVPLGPVRTSRGSSGTRMGPYLSRTPIRVHRVLRRGSSGPVGTCRPHRPKFGQVQKHQICFEVGRESAVWLETKDHMNRIAYPEPSGPLLRPKTAKNLTF